MCLLSDAVSSHDPCLVSRPVCCVPSELLDMQVEMDVMKVTLSKIQAQLAAAQAEAREYQRTLEVLGSEAKEILKHGPNTLSDAVRSILLESIRLHRDAGAAAGTQREESGEPPAKQPRHRQ